MFSALACVAFAFSGFASNEVITENQEIKIEESTTTIEKYVFSEEDGCTICTLVTVKYNTDGSERNRSSQKVRVCNNTCTEIAKKLLDKQEPYALDNSKPLLYIEF